MLMSVTAFAANKPTVYFSVDGRTATGTCYVKSASTEYEQMASYIYASVVYQYRIGTSSTIHRNSSSTANAAYSVHAYTDILSSDQGKVCNHHRTDGTHAVNSSSSQSTWINGTM